MQSRIVPSRILHALIALIALCGLALGNGDEFILPPARSGQQYEANLTEVLRQNNLRIESDAASPRLRWSMDAKNAPAGLKLLSNGIMRGTPQASQRQTHRLTVQVKDESLGTDSLSLQFLLAIERPQLRLVSTAPRLAPLQSTGAAQLTAASAAAQSSQASPPDPFRVSLETPDEKQEKLSLQVIPAPQSVPEVRIWVEESSQEARKEAQENGTCPSDKFPSTFKDFIEAADPRPPVPSAKHEQRHKPGTLDPDKKPGQYTIELFKPLDACDAVFAQAIIGGTAVSSPPVLVSTLQRPKAPILQREDLLEGSKSVSGSTSKGAAVEISVNGHVKKKETADKETGEFSATLAKALKTGDKVVAKATQNGTSAKSEEMTVLKKPALDAQGWVEGNSTVTGSASNGAKIALMVNKSLKGTTDADDNGQFLVNLDEPLKAGDKVVARATQEDITIESEEFSVRLQTRLFDSKLVEGEETVSGEASPGAKIKIEVNGEPKGKEEATADDDGMFTVSLQSALAAGEKVVAKATLDGVTVASEELVVRSLTIDLGRSRFFFSSGVVISKEREDFDQQDPYLAFNWVTNWWRSKPKEPWEEANRDMEEDENGIGKLQMSKFFFNTFMDVQLTSVGIEMEDEDEEADELDAFLASRRSALLQGGFYLPIVTTVWTSPNPNALFFAPIVKVGVQTTTEQEGMPTSNDDVFNFFSFGLRMGHFDLTDLLSKNPNKMDRGRSPQMLSYLDLLWGRWENFEVTRFTDDCTDPTETEDCVEIRKRPWRFALEGRLKIPRVPFYVGMDANLSIEQGIDDVRFLFGTNFDIGKLFQRLSIPN